MNSLPKGWMTWTRMALLCASFLGARTASSGAEPGEEPLDPGLIGEKGLPVARGKLNSGEESALIDKPRIAEETAEHLRGLQEAGNPHIRRGLLITGIEEDPEKAPVDMEKLHEEAVRRIEGPPIEESGLPGGDDLAARHQAGTNIPPKSHLPEYLGISAALLFLAAMAFHVSYRRMAARRPRKPGASHEEN